ncbi:MAG TPA: hypothetical protein VJN22_07625 [Candidatus Eremiobacteraceae bacterium]|nr:hypothetical protein [Candidatus Eremiobacteraceae bacterium]
MRKLIELGRSQRGVALITVILMVVVLLILAGALLDSTVSEAQGIGANGVSNQALNAAYAGVDDMVLKLEENTSGTNVGVPNPFTTTMNGDGVYASQYSVSVTKQWSPSANFQYFLIESKGTAGLPLGGPLEPVRTVDALVRTQPFSSYEMYSISEVNNFGGTVYYTAAQHYDGAVYSGGPMNIMYNANGGAIFQAGVDTAVAPNYRDVNFNPGQPPNCSTIDGTVGCSQMNVGGSPKALPTFLDNLLVASEAYYGDATHNSQNPPSPATNGLYINQALPNGANGGALATGMYIEGDVTIYALGNTTGVNKQYYIFQVTGGPTYDVAIDFNAGGGVGTTTVVSGGKTTIYTGVASGQPTGGSGGNGSIFVNGNVTIGGGTDSTGTVAKPAIGATIHGSYTIGVPDYITNHADNITLNKSITDLDPSSDDVLALWANDIKVNNTTDTTVNVDALMLTGYYGECTITTCNDGTLLNKSCTATTCGGGAGRDLNILGSLVENVRGKLGTAVVGATTCATGFCRQMTYDNRLGSKPPPFSPTTNKYQIIALQYK